MVFEGRTTTVGERWGLSTTYPCQCTDYGLQNSDVAVVLILRAGSTSFAYNDISGPSMERSCPSASASWIPVPKMPPTQTLGSANDYASSLSNRGTTIETLHKSRESSWRCVWSLHEALREPSRGPSVPRPTTSTQSWSRTSCPVLAWCRQASPLPRAQEPGYSFTNA